MVHRIHAVDAGSRWLLCYVLLNTHPQHWQQYEGTCSVSCNMTWDVTYSMSHVTLLLPAPVLITIFIFSKIINVSMFLFYYTPFSTLYSRDTDRRQRQGYRGSSGFSLFSLVSLVSFVYLTRTGAEGNNIEVVPLAMPTRNELSRFPLA